MATQKQEEKRGNGGSNQQMIRHAAQQIAETPSAGEIARTSPISRMRRMLDDLETSLFGWTPASMMRRMLDDMERVFERDFFAGARRVPAYWAPRIDVAYRDDKIIVSADLPGVSRDQIEVTTEDNCLVIEGERPQPSEEAELWRAERSYGRFRRVIALPEGIDPDKVSARFENGVLEIAVPLSPGQVPRRIPIGGATASAQQPGATQAQASQAQAQSSAKAD
jgi:HSP20 family protein